MWGGGGGGWKHFFRNHRHAAEYSEELRTYSVLLTIKALHSHPLLIRNSRVDNIALHPPPLPSLRTDVRQHRSLAHPGVVLVSALSRAHTEH